MAHQPMVRPDPSEPRRVIDEAPSSEATPPKPRDFQPALDYVAVTPSAEGSNGSRHSLDEVLAQLAEQACLATSATASAIALREGEEIVCRATAGPNAPDLGVRLNTEAGLSGACVRTREAQYCDDTEHDPRVNAAACRVLRVRSVLVVPLLKNKELLGIFEIFSPLPHAFAQHDLQNLQALARTTIEQLFGAAVSAPEMPEEVAEPAPPAPQAPKFPVEAALAPEFAEEAEFRPWPELESLPEADLSSETSSEPAIAPEARPDLHAPPSEPAAAPIESAPPAPAVEQSAAAPVVPPAPASAAPSPRPSAAPTREPPALFEELSAPPPRRDWATGFLTVVVIALALLLGWMLGRIGWEHTSERPKEAVDSPVVQAALPKPSPAAPSSSASQSAAESSDGNAPVSAAPILHPSSPREAAPAAEDESSSSGGLVIYEGGKIIFRQNALPNSAGAPDPERDPQPSSAAPGKSAVLLDFQTAGTYLVKQVQPVYPQEARRLRVQGEVVLEALVARNGAVEELELLSGDSRLATAAAEAIRQWRFKPYKPHGVPVNFRTRLMVNFRLPPG